MKLNKLVIAPGVVIGVLVVLAIGGAGVSLLLENQNSFCASCHTEPESKYYQQSLQTNVTTLASFHNQKQTNCIDCHSGGGPLGRAQGLQQGIDDLLIYWSGNYHQPAITSNPLGDDSCLKCHAAVLTRGRGSPPSPIQNPVQARGNRANDGHYHQFLQRWQAADPRAAHCVNCHTSHTDGPANVGYMTADPVSQVCDGCHRGLNARN
jgi:predicted CXXCH cytochrome family protein